MEIRWLPGVAVVMAAGCLTSTTPDPNLQTVAAVAGQVTRDDGTPVGGPFVSLQLLSALSGNTVTLLGDNGLIGDDQGRFLFIFLISGHPAQTGSATITVTPPLGSSLLPFDTLGVPVRINQGDIATDTTYVQIKMTPR